MALHLITTFISHRQKTATTLCGKRVAVSKIVDFDATCPECRAEVEKHMRHCFHAVLARISREADAYSAYTMRALTRTRCKLLSLPTSRRTP